MIKKVRSHVTQNEPLLFELSSPGKRGYQLPELDVPPVDAAEALGAEHVRSSIEGFPEVSEVEAVRHFTRLSTHNYGIDHGLYPLGSCTMKYNPRVNEAVARIDGLAWAHPYQPESLSQGGMEIAAQLEAALLEITGMDAVTLQPAAGAHGELTGILLVRAALECQGNPRKKILIPDSAHGTNPATVGIAGYEVENIASNDRGMVDVEELARVVDENTAALMVTNPNTLGVFEQNITQVAAILHAKGGMIYMDGANMNALAGISRPGDFGVDVMHLNLHKTFSTPHGGGGPGSGPVAVKKHLEPFLPVPRLKRNGEAWSWDYDRPKSIGKVRAYYGNFGVLVRAYTYMRMLGARGMRDMAEAAVLNNAYVSSKLEDVYPLPYGRGLHESVFSGSELKKTHGVKTADVAKRLLDLGFHAPTVYFPLNVSEAIMSEPTESENREELDRYVAALRQIADEAATDPEMVKAAPHTTPIRRMDEVGAARNLDVRWSFADDS